MKNNQINIKDLFNSSSGFVYPYFKAAQILDRKIHKAHQNTNTAQEISEDWLLIFPRNYLYAFCVESVLKQIIKENKELSKKYQNINIKGLYFAAKGRGYNTLLKNIEDEKLLERLNSAINCFAYKDDAINHNLHLLQINDIETITKFITDYLQKEEVL